MRVPASLPVARQLYVVCVCRAAGHGESVPGRDAPDDGDNGEAVHGQ